MEAELGFFLLIFVAMGASCSAALHWYRRAAAKPIMLEHQLATSHLISLASVVCLLLLIVCFIQDNFALEYVVTHSNSQLPTAYKVAAAWGGHQGSMLFWVVTLSLWASYIALSSPINQCYTADCLGIMNVLIAVFAWFTLTTSNPFEFAKTLAVEGRDLNPMLQDIGLIIHPPLLYLGYVGYSAILAFALAALLSKRPVNEWYRCTRKAAYFAWGTLTVGILVGSWWAYNELGWGGWWFWDPVENASLLPWLTGTALLHSGVLAKKNQGALWSTYALAFATFSLSILGTFIVRSGVLTSVHAFAVDPTKGLALLAVLSALLLMTFGVLIVRGDAIKPFRLRSLISRAYMVYVAIGLLVISTAIVFLGTFYPMIYQLLGLGNISVGAPYFNSLIFPLSIFALLALAMTPILRWTKGVCANWKRQFAFASTIALGVVAVFILSVDTVRIGTITSVFLAAWVIATHTMLWLNAENKGPLIKMVLAHVGFSVAVVGAVFNSEYSYQYNLRVEPGVSHQRANIGIDYQGMDWVIGPNYIAEQARIILRLDDQTRYVLQPEKRHYPVRVMNMTEPAILSLWHGDYYLTLGDKVGTNAYAIKVQYRAGIWWIWSGGLIAVFGALTTVYRKRKRAVNVTENYA
ncbi:heme lyase CcmF/NrfE family subunit [Vibrio parahaemolyticus]|uniref:heme lyase CcmF/NrfE family subunit n=1 Tax=Vibrio parahaemolyticus TaxID=670 RepID=UPI0003FCEA1A|nr:heme lyase NrfEFG subunit NrfE [Vibrio parahaemolyticus]EGU6978220.1 heme lyase NrfEFG subunit NrfE [Vibrio parahaemolyticus]EIO2936370.1 heme lyase NrfEFG subunit NrfE [Vibrio parahaemolyticus]EKB1991653.1 heme lyase NrfEFG subunit NrfE [Vibrio parahaemolyticus]EME0135219.1 heme lyase NrfEFG subunit NrfE [Vibrio parahaemolyticus]HCZ9714650.1 heme lyase NrfEFG subunit NrfE [Vibrio parahaemolyticus]